MNIESWLLGYLFNSFWQVPLLLMAGLLAARALRVHGAATVHRVWVCCLLLQGLLPTCPARPTNWLRGVLSLVGRGHAGRAEEVSVVLGPGAVVGLHLPIRSPIVLAVTYLVVLLYFMARLAWGVHNTLAVRRRSKGVDLGKETALFWRSCCERFAVHDAQLATSKNASGPMTLGIRRRFILLPEDLIERLTEEDLRAVIAHEFAHMRRRDFAWNLFYELVSLPVAYHPALWLTRSRLLESREIVCDEMAARAVAGPDRYARSLLRLAALFVDRPATVAPHAIGIFDATTFERRIMKLTIGHKEVHGIRRAAVLTVCAVFGLATCVSALALRAEVYLPNTEKAAPSADSKKSTAVSAGEMAGHVRSKVAPVYPKAAKEAKVQGAVVLRAIIGKDGTIADLQVVSGPKELTRSALDAVRQWTYDPYLIKGEPTEVETNITVNYSLGN